MQCSLMLRVQVWRHDQRAGGMWGQAVNTRDRAVWGLGAYLTR